jgi:hypothetical protein
MKYSEKNPPLVCMMTQSTCYKGTTKGYPVGILWHDTAGGNPNLCRYVQPDDNASNKDELIAILGKNKYNNDFNHIDRQAGLNCWVGKLANGEVSTVQTMPWDFRPWGCGSGSKGSCNGKTGGPFWIQFEICDDGYKDKSYFEKAYKEACEITAYLCKKFNIDPKGTVKYNGVTVPTILCHWDSYKLKLGSGHRDIYLWFDKFGKTMDDVRNDVSKLLSSSETIIYRVRKTWEDASSQIGAYTVLEYAINNCPVGYSVFDPNGNVMYENKETPPSPVPPVEPPEDDVVISEEDQKKFNKMMDNWLKERAEMKPSKWSAADREWAESNGIIAGDTDGNKRYKSFITREEAVAILHKEYELSNKEE